MQSSEIEAINCIHVDIRYWLKEVAVQLADINGNLYAIRQMLAAPKVQTEQ